MTNIPGVIKLSDEYFMRQAITEAEAALAKDEVPIGAVIVAGGSIIARAHNLTETLTDPTAHAEMQAITAATAYMGGKYLSECTIYITVEPCPMCAGALYWSRIGNIVYGCHDLKRGYSLIESPILHPKTIVRNNVLEKECSELVTNFFRGKRR
jgi:tRNA(adenine34) deaminase